MELTGEWVMLNLVSVCIKTVLVSVQYSCLVCAERTTGLEIVLDAPYSIPRWRAQVEARSSLFVDCANLNVILVHCLRQTYHWLKKHFDRTRWNC
jgi:hypothetical protein